MRTGITRTIFALLAVAIAWASVHVWLSSNRTADFSFRNVPIRCAIQLEHSPRHLPGLTVGYNYELLQRFAASMGDSLVKAAAKRLGWDWRLLSALIYSESQFHIELRSRRGAEGLMQMLPSTAAKMGVTDLFNPEESIKAGTEYLLLLQNMFRGKAANKDELCKFTLAAYNAGEGRILDCVRYAESIGADAGTWDGIVSVIPDMRDEATFQVDSVIRLGTFQGTETIAYVKRVLSLYEDFKVISP